MSNEPAGASQPRLSRQDDEYVVVARRYRPSSFEELIGQDQVSRALCNAITSNRVGHAYLFTGARGVGKTSAARILAKALNCKSGPTITPCSTCDICQGVAAGEDVDVLEIDGASNRGIDEIRQLRSNVNVRPSRAKFKIYIIDEVHMLTTAAFNALLKTLEEPPEHVKFIFCTTDPEKIPITVLSRCQRFDFAPVETDAIVERLRFIVDSEAASADEEALQLLARRANGSMRDSQSLLEQLLSFAAERITITTVHQMLGTAQSSRLAAMTSRLVERDASGALEELAAAISEGVEIGQLLEQVLGHFRDMMVAVVGGDANTFLHTPAAEHSQLVEAGGTFGLETLLAIVQILDQTLTKIRHSTQLRTLAEVAFIRICCLERLDELSKVIAQLSAENEQTRKSPSASKRPTEKSLVTPDPASEVRSPAQPAAQKKTKLGSQTPLSVSESEALPQTPTQPSAEHLWQETLKNLEDITADFARDYERVAFFAPNRLVVTFNTGYSFNKTSCERPQNKAKIEEALSRVAGSPMRIDLEVSASTPTQTVAQKPPKSRVQRMRDVEKNALVGRTIEVFDAEVKRVEESRLPKHKSSE
ncbi:MAG: DNA polymerase III subunit gamma/tau [Pirellulaceae bacterium]|nr:DNA polymerase III subunit gamma/tau [Pirellulaceae bacterium]